jgi:hypothetical protein
VGDGNNEPYGQVEVPDGADQGVHEAATLETPGAALPMDSPYRRTRREAISRDGDISRDEVRAARMRVALDTDEQPVLVVTASDHEAAAVFPAEDVRREHPDGGWSVVRRVLHTVLFASLCLLLARSIVLVDRFVAPEFSEYASVGLIVAIFIGLVVVAGIDWASVMAWEMFAVTGLLAAVYLVREGESVVEVLFVTAAFGFAAYGWRRARLVRQSKWVRLRQVVDDHELVEAEVVRHGWYVSRGKSVTSTLRFILESPAYPDRRWSAELVFSGLGSSFAPQKGSRVMMFVCSADPEVAVVRPVIPDAPLKAQTEARATVEGARKTGSADLFDPGAHDWDQRSVFVVRADDAASAAQFPRDELQKLEPGGRDAAARRALHTVLFVILSFVLSMGDSLVPDAVSAVVPGLDLHLPALVLLGVLVVVDARSVRTWEMYAVTGALALAHLIRTDQPVFDTVVIPLLVWVGAAVVGVLRSTHRARWRRLRPVVVNHRYYEAEVLGSRWFTPVVPDGVEKFWLVLGSDRLPGRQWRVALDLHDHQRQAAPAAGSTVAVFACPADPSIVVVRPVLPA